MIRHLEGLHLTATNRRHMGQILGEGRLTGATARLAYNLAPIEGAPGRFAYTIRAKDSDDFGRPITRIRRGVIEATA